MLKYDDIFLPLQDKLATFLGVDVIQAEGVGKKPSYPFATIKKISGPIPLSPPSSKINNVGVKTISQDIELVYSITVNAKIIEDAEDTALMAQLFLEGRGYEELSEMGVTIVEVMPPENRDVFLTVGYERRIGFDIKVRATWFDSYAINTIEQVTINNKEGEE